MFVEVEEKIYLINLLKNKISNKIFIIDDLKIDGDYVESQAFAFLSNKIVFKLTYFISFNN